MHAEDFNVALMLDVLLVGLGLQRNGIGYKPLIKSWPYSMREGRRGRFIANPSFFGFQSPLLVPLDFPSSDDFFPPSHSQKV